MKKTLALLAACASFLAPAAHAGTGTLYGMVACYRARMLGSAAETMICSLGMTFASLAECKHMVALSVGPAKNTGIAYRCVKKQVPTWEPA
jgi:hypothetical protein